MDIYNPEQFRIAVHRVAQRKHDWKSSEFMSIIHFHIIASSRREQIHDNVYTMYFTLYKNLPGNIATRAKIVKTLDEMHWL